MKTDITAAAKKLVPMDFIILENTISQKNEKRDLL